MKIIKKLRGKNKMNNSEKIPASNISDSVFFLMRAAKKRRTQAIAKAKMIQSELGMTPKLVAVK